MSSDFNAHAEVELSDYLAQNNVNALFVQIVQAMLIDRPKDPILFTFQYLIKKYPDICLPAAREAAGAAPAEASTAPAAGAGGAAAEAAAAPPAETPRDADYTDTEEEDEMGEMAEFVPVVKKKDRKCSVMSSSVSVADDWTPPVFDKTPEQEIMLTARVKGIAFMAHLGEKDVNTLVRAFSLMEFTPGAVLMEQGAAGDNFFVLEDGVCDVNIEGVGKVAEKNGQGEANFVGELALLYDAPRSATIVAQTPVKSWALDRTTFKTIMQSSAIKQNSASVGFIESVKLFESLSPMEKMQMADALKPVSFAEGELIIKEGDVGNAFYIVEDGEVICTKNKAGVEVEVSDRLGRGAFFGELALLSHDTRQASVKAVSAVSALMVDRATFKRVLGPLEDILKAHQSSYTKS